MEVEGMTSLSEETLRSHVTNCSTIHIYGAGLNDERPAHTAIGELSDLGWACAPIHPRDAGGTISGFPIRPSLDDGIVPEIVVLFLAPQRAQAVVRDLIVRLGHENFPLIWFQRGAEDERSIEALDALSLIHI